MTESEILSALLPHLATPTGQAAVYKLLWSIVFSEHIAMMLEHRQTVDAMASAMGRERAALLATIEAQKRTIAALEKRVADPFPNS